MPELKQFDNLPAENPRHIQDLDTSNPLAIVQELLNQAAQYIDNTLQGVDHVFIKLRLMNDLKKMQGYTGALYGGPVPGYGGNAQDLTSQPLTRMFGQDLNRVQPINQSSMQPDDIERQAFRDRKNAMAAMFKEQSDDDILASLSQPQGEAIIRGVARSFGLEDYKDRYIDVTYIQDVRDLIRDRETITTATELANKGAEQLQGKQSQQEDDDDQEDDDLQAPLVKIMQPGHMTPDMIIANAQAANLQDIPPVDPNKEADPNPNQGAGPVNAADVNKAGVNAAPAPGNPVKQQPVANPIKPKASNGQFTKKADTGNTDNKGKAGE